MSFDGIFLHHMTKELREALVGGRIQKINQVFDSELVLQIRSQGISHQLLLSAHPSFARVQLTHTTFDRPKTPSTFTMILRKYLSGAFIAAIDQVNNDRQIHFDISSKNEIGDNMAITLIAEIMGKHANIILMDRTSDKIIETIKHIGFSQNQYRTLLPGSTYIAPPSSQKLNPYTARDEQLFDAIHANAPLHQLLEGVGPDTAKGLEGSDLTTLKTRLATIYPSLYDQDRFNSIELLTTAPTAKFDSLSDLLDAYYQDKAKRDRVNQVASQLIKRVASELDKNRNKLAKQIQELTETDQAEIFRQKGELLTTYLHEVPNNLPSITLLNYYTNEPLEIALDVTRSPSQNAQRYFHKYQKLKQAVKVLNQQIENTKDAITYLESVELALSQAEVAEIPDIKEELIQTGFIKLKYRDKKQQLLPPEVFWASDGTKLLVGKNNLQNEQVSFKLAKKGDLWFHAKDIPGSHVIITGNPHPSDETITEAALLAAYFSKARLSNLVQVDMIEAKKLHKPTGTPPGFVTYTGQKTLRVTPEQNLVEQMRSKK